MPLWKFYHPVGAFSAEDKQAIASRNTSIYRALHKVLRRRCVSGGSEDVILRLRRAGRRLCADMGRPHRASVQ